MYKHSAQQFFLLSGISEGSTSNIRQLRYRTDPHERRIRRMSDHLISLHMQRLRLFLSIIGTIEVFH